MKKSCGGGRGDMKAWPRRMVNSAPVRYDGSPSTQRMSFTGENLPTKLPRAFLRCGRTMMIATNQDVVAEDSFTPLSFSLTRSSTHLIENDFSPLHGEILSSNTPVKAQDVSANLKDITRICEAGLSDSMEKGEDDKVEGYQGGLVAGSSIPAGVSLGQWPEESATLGGDLLSKNRHPGEISNTLDPMERALKLDVARLGKAKPLISSRVDKV
ncbi:hypothetical protein RRG08_052004 [Elysia crispata]|uniref:Uncharacterized protein n=1 Tax=Elysia crispata TaxID=231223 RepID=A0AAE1DDS8_9GAST|nr:hypothetical protein RRG08_052004 [Elysia crispata]